jgi:hypothetical protein
MDGTTAPDFDLRNQIEGVQTWPDVQATIYSDGTVLWIRSGSLRAFCSFKGLAEISFDTLGCQYTFGSRNRMDKDMVHYKLANEEAIAFGPFDVVYNEWTVVLERTNTRYTFDGEIIFYDFYFQRAETHYIQNLVVPTIILTYVSFLTFLLDLRIGERLRFGMVLALVVVAQHIVTTSLIPVSNQMLWIDKFVGWYFYWVLVGLVESAIVGYIYYMREDREAKRLKKRLRLMSAGARDAMMDHATAAAVGDDNHPDSSAIDEEAAPLTPLKTDGVVTGPNHRNVVPSDRAEPGCSETTAHHEESRDRGEKKKNRLSACFHDISLRKIDCKQSSC